ncbi:FecR family protein [Chitinophaga varians]|uniref:FecR family protein n=1 Tax=Chitinophaga varians TaxID=2202339 RepID=UPI00165F8A3C|nr:FecR domain-containing protein [Chitinophaga varians]MBC9915394.1 FecR domain-containing protein [Chitinophaga varians]
MTEKKAGIISAADEALLDAYLEEVPEAREMWKAIESGKQLQDHAPWRNTYSITDASARLPMFKWGIAVGIFVAVFAIYWYAYQKYGVNVAANTESIPAPPVAMLALADGTVHPLTATPATLSVGQQSLAVQAGSLSLQSAVDLPSGINTLTVPNASHYKITLADGTEIWLNAGSELKFPFSFTQPVRETFLRGEAYFRIATNANQPFVLQLPNSTVQVLGTSFHVSTKDPQHIRVSLTEGSLRMTAGSRQIVLRPGQQAIYNDSARTFDVQRFTEQEADAWRKRQFYFSSVTLAGLKTIASRHYGLHGVIDTSRAIHKLFIASPGGEPLPAGILLPAPAYPAEDSMKLLQ